MAKTFPGVPPLLPIFFFKVDPLDEASCAVAHDNWGGASVGECGRVEVGEGDAFWNLSPMYWSGDTRYAAQGGLARGGTLGAPVWGSLEEYLGRQ